MSNMNILIEIGQNDIYISHDGSSGVSYYLGSKEDLKSAICDYIDSMPELDSFGLAETKGDDLASLIRKTLKEQGKDELCIYADYRDTIEPARAVKLLQDENGPLPAVTDFVMEMYEETYEAHVCEAERAIRDELQKRGLYADPDEVQDIVRDSITTDYPLSHFVTQTYHTLILVDTGDGNHDFTCNIELARGHDARHWDKASLAWLAARQGHGSDEIKRLFAGKGLSDSRFLKSAYDEVFEAPSDIQVLTFLTEMTLSDLIRLSGSDRKKGHITLSNNTMCGLYDPVTGGGSLLGLELEKDVEIPLEYVWSCLPDVPTDKIHYSVEDTYGMAGNAYTRSRCTVTIE